MNLVLGDISRNVPIPLVSPNSPKIPFWNNWGEHWIISIFDFVRKFLTIDGVMLLLHPDDPQVFKEIMSYLESCSFQIHMKWVVINSFPLASLEDHSLKAWAPIFSLLSSHPFPSFLLSNIVSGMLQTLLSWVILLVRASDLSSSSMSSFRFPLPFKDFL